MFVLRIRSDQCVYTGALQIQRDFAIRLEAIALSLESMALRLEAIADRTCSSFFLIMVSRRLGRPASSRVPKPMRCAVGEPRTSLKNLPETDRRVPSDAQVKKSTPMVPFWRPPMWAPGSPRGHPLQSPFSLTVFSPLFVHLISSAPST